MYTRRFAALAVLSSFLAFGQRVEPRIHSAEAEENLKKAARRDLPSLRLRLPMPLEHRLPALGAEDIKRAAARLDAESPKLGGLHRSLFAEALDSGRWHELAGGKRVWRFALHSPSAE